MGITSSLFGLVKYNAGRFKSDLQADYIMRFVDRDGVFVTTQDLTFGEYEGKTDRNSARVTWEFHINKTGIQKIYKITSKITVLWWHFSEEEVLKSAWRVEKKEKIEVLNALHEKWLGKVTDIESRKIEIISDVLQRMPVEEAADYLAKLDRLCKSTWARIDRKCEKVEELVTA